MWCKDIYMGVSLLAPECAVLCCAVLWMCVISNQSTSKKPHVSDLSKRDVLLHKTHIKVLLVQTYQGATCVDPNKCVCLCVCVCVRARAYVCLWDGHNLKNGG